jgi:small-conductance mechanosensitive channel
MPNVLLSRQAKADRDTCLANAEAIRQLLVDNKQQLARYIGYYTATEYQLSNMNNYASQRYQEIQTNIFRNGDSNYLNILQNLPERLESTWNAISKHGFIFMEGGLLMQFFWLMGVVVVSLLLRVKRTQLRSAISIYLPLLTMGLVVILFRIILIPNDLVNLVFPPMLLAAAIWQWWYIRRHRDGVPMLDTRYAYLSLTVFVVSVVCSWLGYTLISVQLIIWWTMQLSCALTITCAADWMSLYSKRKRFNERPITRTWLFHMVRHVGIPILSIFTILFSIWWAADVFNLSALCVELFTKDFINLENLKVSLLKLSIVVCNWFVFAYIVKTVLAFMRLHYVNTDPSTAASKEVMGKNVVQVLVWGAWALSSLSLLHISVAWLMAISGGLSTGIGFASKDIIENIYYGATLMAGRVKVGDWIDVDGTIGKVTSISYTSTVVESLYGEVITFQNAQLFAKNYKNLTKNHGYILVAIPFGVAYGSNLRQVEQVVVEAVSKLDHPWTDHSKEVKVVTSGMNDSSVDFKLFIWSDAVKRAYVISDVTRCIYDTLYEHNISIPFPQRDIHIIPTDH